MLITPDKKNALLLFLAFLVFYTIQIPEYTWKTDVITFTIRSLEESPVTDYAYLEEGTLLSGSALPNYHIGHSLILWLFYSILPADISQSIIPAGLLSAFAASAAVALTYLISIALGLSRKRSVFIAATFALVPTFWEHALIGEIHALQMLFILLFLYNFIKSRLSLSIIAFTVANLISPLSGLALSLVFLKGLNKTNFKEGMIVGILSLVLYILVIIWFDIDLTRLLGEVSSEQSGRGFIYRIGTLLIIVAINFNLFLFYFIKGLKKVALEKTYLLKYLIIAAAPQIALALLSADFLIEYGSFQLILFWIIAFPTGFCLSEIKLKSFYFALSLIVSIILTYSIWIHPHRYIGSSLEEAGIWLRENNYSSVPIIGAYDAAIGIIEARNGKNLEYLNKYFFDKPFPEEEDIMDTDKSKLIIAHNKKLPLRKLAAETKIEGLKLQEYNPPSIIDKGKIKKIFDNRAVTLYEWTQ